MNINENGVSSTTQCALIKRHLLAGGSLTPLEAEQAPFRCMRLGARIYDLKQDGLKIDGQMMRTISHMMQI